MTYNFARQSGARFHHKMLAMPITMCWTYPATISDIEVVDGTYGKALKWVFDVESDPRTTRTAYSSMATSRKAKARKWAQAVLGRAIQDGEELETDELIDSPRRLVIAHKIGESGEAYDVVDTVLSEQAAEKPARPRPAAESSTLRHDDDSDETPF